jgi:hypothetical protein
MALHQRSDWFLGGNIMSVGRLALRLTSAALIVAVAASSTGLSAKDALPIKVEKPESFKGATQVVIGQFTVAYLTKKIDYDGGGFLAASAEGKAIGHLSGLTAADYQKTTDAIYADFSRQLAAHGVSIVDPAGLLANKYYAKVKHEAQGESVDIMLKKKDHADATAYWPTQLGRNDNALLQLRMMDMNMGNTYTAQYDYARTAKVPVLNIVYVVDFAKPAKSDGGGLFQTVKASAGLAMSQFGTQIGLMDTTGKMAKILLMTPIEEGGDFANITETTSGLNKVVRVAGLLGGGLGFGGGGRMGMSARFDYNVTNPGQYGEKAVSAATKTSDLFLRQLEALR